MSISRIGFTSSLLNSANMQPSVNKLQEEAVKEDSTVQTEQTEQQPEAIESDEVITNPLDEGEKSHTVRNWSIGLSAAAVLIGLGVVAGYKGHLGKGIQKALGGKASSTADHAAGEVAGKGAKAGEEATGHTGIKTDEISADEFEQIQNKEVDFVYGSKKNTGADAEPTPTAQEPKVETPKEEPTPKVNKEPKVETPKEEPTPKVNEEPKVETPKEEPTPRVNEEPKVETPKEEPTPKVNEEPKVTEPSKLTITKAEAQAIDASLDRTLPKIEKEMLSLKVPTIQELKQMGFDLSKFEMSAKPNSQTVKIIGDKKYFARYDKKGELYCISQGFKDAEHVSDCNVYLDIWDGKIIRLCSKNVSYYCATNRNCSRVYTNRDNIQYIYDEKGLLERALEKNSKGKVLKDIAYLPGTDKPVSVYYGGEWHETSKLSKIEVFDGQPNPVKEIYIKDGQEITNVV